MDEEAKCEHKPAATVPSDDGGFYCMDCYTTFIPAEPLPECMVRPMSERTYICRLTRGEAAALAGAAKVVIGRFDDTPAGRTVHKETLANMESGLDLLRDVIGAIDHGWELDSDNLAPLTTKEAV